jgi:hypothetical protein
VAGPGGGLTALDPTSGQPVGPTISLPAHPESFQLEVTGPRVFVNLPGASATVMVLDRATRRQIAIWSVSGYRANFPMALDESGGRLFVGFRGPPTLGVLDLGSGAVLARLPLCEDVDDLFVDARRHRVYAICGEGVVETFEDRQGSRVPHRLALMPSAAGARTGLFVPEFDRLFVAARAQAGEPAALWVLRPDPLP